MARGKRLTDEQRASIVAELLSGKSISQVAEEAGVGFATVHRIKESIPTELEKVGKERSQHIGDMVAQNVALNLAALNAYAQHTSSPDYIRTQTAGDMAALHAAVAGHVWRLLDFAARIGVSTT